MAGVMAALAAKTPENSVLMIEPSNVLGGQGTAGGVAGFCGDTERVNADFADLIAKLHEHGLITPLAPKCDRRDYDLEWCAFFLQEMVCERGIEVLLHSRVVDAACSDGIVRSVLVATSGGLINVSAKFVIDASGACVVPYLTGFPVIHEGANKQLPMSLYFTMWDTGKKVRPVLPAGCPRWENDQEIPMTSLHIFPHGKTEVKMKVVGFDAASGRDLSGAEMFARRQMHGLIYYLQTTGYRGVKLDTSVLASVSRTIGIREERRIVGEHMLTEAEARNAVIFPDAVAVNTYHIDFHWPDRAQRAGTGIVDQLDPHHLPLRMMIPKGARNMLVPGRGASADQKAMSAFRVMAVVAQMGFAAGHAARLCAESGQDVGSLDLPKLQRAITAGGQSLDLSDYGNYLRRDIFWHQACFENRNAFSECGETVLMAMSNGRFLAAWQGATGGTRGIWVSERRQKKWSEPQLVAAHDQPLDGRIILERLPDSSAVLLSAGTVGYLSKDEGRTWQKSAPGGIASETNFETITSGERSATARLDDGTRALVFNPVPSANAEPAALCVALSDDDGETWKHRFDIVSGVQAVSCPSIVPTRVGMAIFYIEDHAVPTFWHGSVERVIDGAEFVETGPLA